MIGVLMLAILLAATTTLDRFLVAGVEPHFSAAWTAHYGRSFSCPHRLPIAVRLGGEGFLADERDGGGCGRRELAIRAWRVVKRTSLQLGQRRPHPLALGVECEIGAGE